MDRDNTQFQAGVMFAVKLFAENGDALADLFANISADCRRTRDMNSELTERCKYLHRKNKALSGSGDIRP